MIAVAKPIQSSKRSAPAWHQQFLILLPAIRRHAQIAFRPAVCHDILDFCARVLAILAEPIRNCH